MLSYFAQAQYVEGNFILTHTIMIDDQIIKFIISFTLNFLKFLVIKS